MLARNQILIIDADHTTASVMCLYLEKLGFDVCQAVRDAAAGVRAAKSYKPNLVLSETSTDGEGDGIEAAWIIIRKLHIPVVFVTTHQDDDTLQQVRTLPAAGFINKPLRESDLKTTLFLALHNGNVSYGRQTEPEAERPPMMCQALKRLYKLTSAEAKIVAAIVQKPDIDHIASTLHISTSTVRTHLKNIYLKTGTNRQAALLHKVLTGPVGGYLDFQ